MLYFGPFGFDVATGRLTQDGAELPLGRTAARVLAVLLEHRPHAVAQDEILRTVWPSTVVDRGAVKGYIRDLRAVLGDDARAPRFIASEDGGYRFVATIATRSAAERDARRSAVVGREDALAVLRDAVDGALGGERRIVFVVGEAGIGKTTAVELLLEEAAAARHLVTGRGQCVEHSGSGMAYLPVLEALERVCRSDAGPRVIDVLRRHAPTWLVQLPVDLPPDERAALERGTQSATQERLFRELARALELLTVDDPLALWLEDLHWCDPETVALLSFLARRTEPARLCIIGTYRPVDAILHQQRMKALAQELHARGDAAIVLLPFLPMPAIEAYVRQRFPGGATLPITDLCTALQGRTEGNPLFLVRVLEHAVARGILALRDGAWTLTAPTADLATLFPASLRDLIAQQIGQLTDDERQVLEAASVVGEDFTLAEVAAALECASDVVDRCCETLARQRQLLLLGEPERWPDGTLTLRARFVHGLYQQAVHEQVLPTRPPAWHARIAARKAAAHGGHTAPIAAELAAHFARAGDPERAERFHHEAGRHAMRHQAHRVAVAQYTAALELLARRADGPERAAHEAELQVELGVTSMAARGYSAPEVERAFRRARELCDRIGEGGPLFPTLYGLWGFHVARGEYREARPLAERMLRVADELDDAALRLQALQALGQVDYCQGAFAAAEEHLRRSVALYDPAEVRELPLWFVHAPAVLGACYLGWTLWMRGLPDQALRTSVDAVTLARKVGHAQSLVLVLHGAHLVHAWRGEWAEARHCAEEAVAIAVQHELPFWAGMANMGLGAVMVRQGEREEGAARVRAGYEAYVGVGGGLGVVQALVGIAEGHARAGNYEDAFAMLAAADTRADANGGDDHAAEVARLRGVLVLRRAAAVATPPRRGQKTGARKRAGDRAPDGPAADEAEASLLRALTIARRQGSRAWELRAATSLATLWSRRGKSGEGRDLLTGLLDGFAEGRDTADVTRALEVLHGSS